MSENEGNVLKIVRLGLEGRIFDEMKKPGFSAESMARKLKTEGQYVSAQSIRKFIRKSKKAQQKLIQQDLKTAHELTKAIKDYGGYLKKIMDEVEEVKDRVRAEGDMASYNQMVDKLYKGVELIAKLTGDIKPKGAVDIKIIYNEINADVEKEMRDIKKEMFKDVVIDVDYEIEKEDKDYEKELKGEK